MPAVENIKPVTIVKKLSTASSFTAVINVPFVPDTVEVAAYSFEEAGGVDNMVLVRSSLFGNDYAFGFGTTANTTANGRVGAEFPIHTSVAGIYTFELLNPDTVLASVTGALFITLIFRKYRGPAPK